MDSLWSKKSRSSGAPDGYEKLPAMDKLRLLLMLCEIPGQLPARLRKLSAQAKKKENNWKDGPQSFTEVRNALVHANPVKRKKVLDERRDIVRDAWRLGLWYLELVILFTVGYKGKYWDHLSAAQSADGLVVVPWLRSP